MCTHYIFPLNSGRNLSDLECIRYAYMYNYYETINLIHFILSAARGETMIEHLNLQFRYASEFSSIIINL